LCWSSSINDRSNVSYSERFCTNILWPYFITSSISNLTLGRVVFKHRKANKGNCSVPLFAARWVLKSNSTQNHDECFGKYKSAIYFAGKIFGTSISEQFEAGKDIISGVLTLESTSLEKNKKLVDHAIDGINTAKNKIIDFANSAKLPENMLKNEIPVPSTPVSANNTNTLNNITFITGYQNKKATTEVDGTGGVL